MLSYITSPFPGLTLTQAGLTPGEDRRGREAAPDIVREAIEMIRLLYAVEKQAAALRRRCGLTSVKSNLRPS